jgi:hypothetical protein
MQIVRAETEFNHGYPVPTGRPEQEFGDLDPPPPYQVGVQCRWLVADFCHLVEVWKELREMNRKFIISHSVTGTILYYPCPLLRRNPCKRQGF